jgi:hypothetical protein
VTDAWRIDWKDQIGDQKLKGLLHPEMQFAMCGRDARFGFKRKGRRDDPHKMPSYGTQPSDRGDKQHQIYEAK